MKTPSLSSKVAYYAQMRQSNYAASLRLEGFASTPRDSQRKLPTREEVLQAYRKEKG